MKISSWYKSLSKNHRILFYAIIVFIVLDILLVTGFAIGNKYSSLKLSCVGLNQKSSLLALNSNGRKAKISDNDYAYFKFTENQKNLIKEVYEQFGTVALSVRVKIDPTTKQSIFLDGKTELPFEFGFLNEDDFTEKGKFKKQIYPNTRRIVIQCNEQFSPGHMDLSLALQKSEVIEKYIPNGFFVHSAFRCFIEEAAVVPSVIGFDRNSEVPFYGFAYNGGVINFENKSFDFTGASLVFPVKSKIASPMPDFVLVFSDNAEFKSTLDNSVYVDISFGGEKLRIKNVSNANRIIIPAAALKAPYGRVEISSNAHCVESLILQKNTASNSEAFTPVKTDPGLILKYKIENWRVKDYEIYEWDRYPGILFFDTKDYDIQSKFFTRLAYFVEKQGYKGRLLTDEELEGKHGYNAHDYNTESLARFFNKASDLNFKLNEYELLLKKILIENKLFETDGVYVKANPGGIVSISRETAEWSRTNLFAHEGWHMQFFRDEEFRNYVTAVYHTCDAQTKDFLIDFFRSQPSLGYDTNDEYLMYNEFMAYVMEKPVSIVAEDFVKKANWASVMKFTPELSAYIRNTKGRGFEDISNALNDFVFDKYGIVAGNISLVNR